MIEQLLAILTIIGQIFILGLAVVWTIHQWGNKSSLAQGIIKVVKRQALKYGLIVALVAMSGSLYYSEILGYAPCKLCWYQRILMYPMVIVFGVALWRKDRGVSATTLVMSILGAIVAFYHYLLQLGLASEITPCSTVGYSVSCAEKFTMHFGYITIPMMALTAFLLIAFTAAIELAKKRG